MRKVRRKKITPRLCSLGSTVWEQEKHLSNTKAHTRHSHRGSESGPANSHPVPQPLIRRWSDPPDRPADQSERRRVVEGGAMSVMSVGWGRKQERFSALLSRGLFQQQPCQGHCVGEPEKDKIVLSLGRVNAFQFCRLLSLSILVSI